MPLKKTILQILALTAILGGWVTPVQAQAKKPNVILILADDLGYETLSAYGSESFDTPVLDDLAADGLTFEYCYATPLCTPTRVSIMTGKYNHRNYTRFGLFPKEDANKTFGNLMKDAGYATCIAGKWQLGPQELIDDMGFDETLQCDSWLGFYDSGPLWRNGKREMNPTNRYRPDIVNDFVLDFIERKKDEPFFVYYPLFLVHAPEEPSPDYPNKELIEKCKNGKRVKVDEFVFGDMLTYMDKLIGKVVTKLEETGTRENTIIMFLGDNGTVGGHAGPREEWAEVIIDGKPHPTGGKGSLKDLGTHVPFIANWKGVTKGTRTSDLVDITDFLPSLADMANHPLEEDRLVDGVSFYPQILGQPGTPREWAFVLHDLNDAVLWRAALAKGITPREEKQQGRFWSRTERWKLYSDGQLFDTQNDPFEDKPILVENDNELAAMMRKKLEAVFEQLDISQDDMMTFQQYKENVESGAFVRHPKSNDAE